MSISTQSSINKSVRVDIPVIGDAAETLQMMIEIWRDKAYQVKAEALASWWKQIAAWQAVKCLAYKQQGNIIKPQYALERLRELTKDHDTYITTEVGQHQMWAAQYLNFDKPNRWMTSGGLGTMGYGLPAAIGVQMAHPKALVIDVAGEASILMNIQEMATAVQYRLPLKSLFLTINGWAWCANGRKCCMARAIRKAIAKPCPISSNYPRRSAALVSAPKNPTMLTALLSRC